MLVSGKCSVLYNVCSCINSEPLEFVKVPMKQNIIATYLKGFSK